MSKRRKGLVAYIVMPLIFTLMGAGIFIVSANIFAGDSIAMLNGLKNAQRPEFKDEKQSEFLDAENITKPSYGAFYANLYCERFEYFGSIRYGTSVRLLKKGVCQYETSSLPGFGGNLVLTGDNEDYLWFLEDIEDGDLIKIATGYGEYEYKVSNIKIGYADRDEELYPPFSNEETLILYTDYPFKSKHKTVEEEIVLEGDGTHKIVWAQKVSGPIINKNREGV